MHMTTVTLRLGAALLAFSTVPAWSQVCTQPPPNMVSWWPGDGNANDIEDGNSGTIVGGVTFVPGEVAQAFSIDGGPGSGVPVGNPANLRLQTFTIDAWIKRGSTAIASNTLGGGVIFGYGYAGYALAIADTGQLFLTQIGLGATSTPTPVITDTAFHLVAVTHSNAGTGQTTFYVDGVAVYTNTTYNPVFTFSIAAVGERADISASNSFLGLLDEIEVFNRVLAPSEVMAINAAGSAGKCKFTSAGSGAPFQIRYVSHLDIGDSVINISNDGSSAAGVGSGASLGNGNGDLCIGVYTFDMNEELQSCCTCLVTPNGLVSLSVDALNATNLTGGLETSLVIKLLAWSTTACASTTAAPGTPAPPVSTSCNAASPGMTASSGSANLASGMHAWGTTVHALPVGQPDSYTVTETDFSAASLSAAEFNHITQFCEFAPGLGHLFSGADNQLPRAGCGDRLTLAVLRAISNILGKNCFDARPILNPAIWRFLSTPSATGRLKSAFPIRLRQAQLARPFWMRLRSISIPN